MLHAAVNPVLMTAKDADVQKVQSFIKPEYTELIKTDKI